MKKYKNDLKTILEVLLFLVIYFSFSALKSPIITIAVFGLAIVYWSYNLYTKLQYRKGNADYMLIPTVNDQYSKITSIVLGLAACALSISAIVWKHEYRIYGSIGIAVGLLILLNGIFDLPKGRLKIDGNILTLTGIDEKVDIRQLSEINIYSNKLVITNMYSESQRLDNLNLDAVSAQRIENYIIDNKKGSTLKVINNVG